MGVVAGAFALVTTWPGATDVGIDLAEPPPAPALERLPALTATTIAASTIARRPIDIAPTAIPDVVALPDPIRRTAVESELVALGMDGSLYTLSLPSGRVESVDVGLNGFFDGGLAVGPDATLISSFGRGVTVVGRDGTVVAVDDDLLADDTTGLGPVVTIDGRLDIANASSFMLTIRDRASGERHRVLVGEDGRVDDVAGPVPDHFGGSIRSHGVELRNDAGGVYAIRAQGAERIAPGRVIAASETHALVRSCDEQLDCTSALVDLDTGDATPLDLDTDLPTSHVSVAPDASAVSFTRYGMFNERVLIGIDGAVAVEPVRVDNFDSAAWSSDGSGEFIVPRRTGLVFVDLESGRSHAFAEQLGPIAAIGLRPLAP